jgi:diguanylate cyclase
MKGIVAQLCGVILGVSFVGFQWLPTSNMIVVIACIPILLLYPIFISTISYKLSNALSRQKRVLFHLSQHDALTGLYNRGHWEQQLIQEFKNSRTFNEPTCLILLDIDHFKLVNDRFGHCTGDEVLRRVGKLIRDNLRPLDIPGRYGGEEFGVVLPESSKETAVAVAQRLRAAIEKSLISTTDQHTIKITVSLGVALLNDNTQDCSQWIDNADKALYQAKQSGRNRSILFECENNRQRA